MIHTHTHTSASQAEAFTDTLTILDWNIKFTTKREKDDALAFMDTKTVRK